MQIDHRKPRFIDIAMVVGLVVNLLVVFTLLVKWGVWQGTIQTQIANISCQLKEMSTIPGRVSYLEGYVFRDNGGKPIKKN